MSAGTIQSRSLRFEVGLVAAGAAVAGRLG